MILLENKAVSDDQNDVASKDRKLVVNDEFTKYIDAQNAELVAFFDAYDDGLLDILVVTTDNKIHAFINNLGIDATWIKAMILEPRARARPCRGEGCGESCPWT